MSWYHTMLCHQGQTRTEAATPQHFTSNSVWDVVHQHMSACIACGKQKHDCQRYGHLPAKEVGVKPCQRLCIDIMGPYTVKRSDKKELKTLKCVTMTEPATGLFEVARYDDKQVITVEDIVQQSWLSRYPHLSRITLDKGDTNL